MPYSIRQLRITDARAVRDIFIEIFDECEDSRYAEAWRKRSADFSLGYFLDGHLVGFTLVAKARHGFYLNYIAVHPEYQGKNIGSELLRALLLKLQAARLSLSLIPVDNPKTIRWYSEKGFYVSHEWKTREGLKALYMTRHFYNTRNCPSL
jgi:ribosomal protein S18 acetylase RimI-like enzyme